MTQQKGFLVNYVEFEKSEKVGLGDGKTVEAMGIGNANAIQGKQIQVSCAVQCTECAKACMQLVFGQGSYC